jgi:hypothetical protein
VYSFEDEPEAEVIELISFEAVLTKLLDTPGHPHRACVVCHACEDAVGLVRSELMVLIGMMMTRLRRKEEEFLDDDTYPVGFRPCFLSYSLTQTPLTRFL